MVLNATRGRTIDLGAGATLTLLTPPDPPITRSRSDVNANSVVVRLDYRATGILFAADAEPQTEKWLLARRAAAGAGPQGRAPRRALFVDAAVPERGRAEGGGDIGRRGQRVWAPDAGGARPPGAAARPRLSHRPRRHGDGGDRRGAHRGDDGERQARDTVGKMTKTPSKTKTTAVFVDAVENGRARLLFGSDAFTVPAALLPDDAGEGSWLQLSTTITPPGRSGRAPPQAGPRRSGRPDQAVTGRQRSL